MTFTMEQVRGVLDAALESTAGVTLVCHNVQQARNFRHLMHKARYQDRTKSKKIYDTTDPQYGRSVWDSITSQIQEFDDGTARVIIKAGNDMTGLTLIDNETGEIM